MFNKLKFLVILFLGCISHTCFATDYEDENLKEVLSSVNLRGAPHINSNILGVLPGGFVVSVTGWAEQSNKWFRVKGVEGEYPSGYVSSDLLADPSTSYKATKLSSAGYLMKVFRPREELDAIHPQSHVRLYSSDGDFVSHLPRIKDLRSLSGVYNYPHELDSDFPFFEIYSFSGGAHCCSESLFISKEFPLRTVAHIKHRIIEKRYVKEREIWEFDVPDQTYAYWQFGYAYSPQPTVTLELTENGPEVSRETMTRSSPRTKDLKTLISTTPQDGTKVSHITYVMLDLIYDGDLKSAEIYLESVWPDAFRHEGSYDSELWDRDEYKEKLLAKIKTSPFFRPWMLKR